MNIKFLVVSILVLLVSTNRASSSILEPQLGSVSTTTAKVYTQPDSDSEVVTIVNKGSKVVVVDETDDCYQIIVPDSFYIEGWLFKNALLTQKLDGDFTDEDLNAIKAFLYKFFGDEIHFWVRHYRAGAKRQHINSLKVQSISINERNFLIIDYPFPKIPPDEEYTGAYTPLLLLEWKNKELIPRNFWKHYDYTCRVDFFNYFDSREAKEMKNHFMIAEIYEHFFNDYEKAIEKYKEITILFPNSIYESGINGEAWSKGNAAAMAWFSMALLYSKLGNCQKAVECLYQIIKSYPDEIISWWEGWGFIDLLAAASILKIKGLNFSNYWIRIWHESFSCTSENNRILDECERIIIVSESKLVKSLGILGIIKYYLNNLELPIDVYMKLLSDYPDICIRDLMEDDYYPILEALNLMCEFLERYQKYDQEILLIHKSLQALPTDVSVPPTYSKEERMSCADYLYKGIEKRLKRIEANVKYPLASVVGTKVHFRKQPIMQSESIGFLNNMERVAILENKEDWYHIMRYDGNEGWVLCKFITPTE